MSTRLERVMVAGRSLRGTLGIALELAHQVITESEHHSSKERVELASQLLRIIGENTEEFDNATAALPQRQSFT